MAIKLRKENVRRKSRHNAPRARSFKTEEAAHTYAKANGIKKYTLKNTMYASSPKKKLRIVEE